VLKYIYYILSNKELLENLRAAEKLVIKVVIIVSAPIFKIFSNFAIFKKNTSFLIFHKHKHLLRLQNKISYKCDLLYYTVKVFGSTFGSIATIP